MVPDHLPESRSLVQVKIGNKVFDARKDPKCKVCNHPARMEVEMAIADGWAYSRIARDYSNVDYSVGERAMTLPVLSWQNVRTHFRAGHMPMGVELQRRLSEKRAAEIGSKYEDAADKFVDHYVVAQAVLHRGHERLVRGELEPDLKDTMAAAKFLKEIDDAAAGQLDTEAWSQAMTIYFETAQELMEPPVWQAFIRKLSTNPVLAAIARKLEGQDDDPNVVDAEIVEEQAK